MGHMYFCGIINDLDVKKWPIIFKVLCLSYSFHINDTKYYGFFFTTVMHKGVIFSWHLHHSSHYQSKKNVCRKIRNPYFICHKTTIETIIVAMIATCWCHRYVYNIFLLIVHLIFNYIIHKMLKKKRYLYLLKMFCLFW